MGATFTRGKSEAKSTMVVSANSIIELNALIKENQEEGWVAIESHKVVEVERTTLNSIGVTNILVEYSITMQK
jgi:hypothetical protein